LSEPLTSNTITTIATFLGTAGAAWWVAWMKSKKDRHEKHLTEKARTEREQAVDTKLDHIKQTTNETRQLTNGSMGAQLKATARALRANCDTLQQLYELTGSNEHRVALETAQSLMSEAESRMVEHEVTEQKIEPSEPPPEITARMVPPGSVNVVMVEDNDGDARLMLEILKNGRFPQRVRVFSRGDDALDFLFRRGDYLAYPVLGNVQLIVLDFAVPRVSGVDILKQIKGDPNLRIIPVVVFTGSLLPTDIEASYRLGANGCIQKPTSGADFNRVVGSMFNFFLSVNQLHPLR